MVVYHSEHRANSYPAHRILRIQTREGTEEAHRQLLMTVTLTQTYPSSAGDFFDALTSWIVANHNHNYY